MHKKPADFHWKEREVGRLALTVNNNGMQTFKVSIERSWALFLVVVLLTTKFIPNPEKKLINCLGIPQLAEG